MTETWPQPKALAIAEGYVPPQDVEAERSILCAMLLGNEAVGRAIEVAEPRIFYRAAHQKIYSAIVALYNANERADIITVCEELRKRGDLEAVGGRVAIAQLTELATTPANLEEHVRIVRSKAQLRELIDATRSIQAAAYAETEETDTILDDAERRLFQVTDTRIRKTFVPIKDLVTPAFAHIENLSQHKTLITGVPSGYDDIDRMTSGFQPGDLIIIAGRPSMGKSSFAVNIVEHAAIKSKVPSAIFSLEMGSQQLVLRMFCSQSEVPLHKVRSGYVDHNHMRRLMEGANRLYNAPIMIDDSAAPTVLEIRAKCRRLKAAGNLGLVVIDYLQMIQASGRAENRVQEVSQITRALKALAKEIEVPVIALSQLSRATDQRTGTDRRPQLSDLRDSGSIEQDSDVVMFVYREEYYKPDDPTLKGKATIMISKQRNGPTGEIDLTFLREFTKFVPYSPIMPGETEPDF